MPALSNNVDSSNNNTYLNPILRGNYADPAIIRVEQDYYMVNTSYKYVPGLIIWHSRDLIHWQPISYVLSELTGDVWAPDFVYYQGFYYIYLPANRTNYVVTADSPYGPWSKPVDLKLPYIDPCHVVGPDHRRYLHLSDGKMVRLSDDGLSVDGEVQHVYDPWLYPDDWEVEAFSLEGPKLTYYHGYYYLTVAQGGTSGPPTSHMVASSRSRKPWGPWEHSPYNPILRTKSAAEHWWSQGHGSLIDTPQGDWWMVYHAYEQGLHTLGRHTMLLPVEWTEDGWYKVQEGVHPEQPIIKPQGEAVEHGWPQSDFFTGSKLGMHWQTFGNPQAGRYQLNDGSLGISGINENQPCSPLLYMAADPSYEVEIGVKIEGNAEGRLLLFYDPSAYFGIGFSAARQGVRHFRSFKSYRYEPVQGHHARLRIRNDRNVVSFYYRTGDSWQKYDKVLDSSGFHHNTFGGFLSLRIGIDAVGEGIARFDEFIYRSL